MFKASPGEKLGSRFLLKLHPCLHGQLSWKWYADHPVDEKMRQRGRRIVTRPIMLWLRKWCCHVGASLLSLFNFHAQQNVTESPFVDLWTLAEQEERRACFGDIDFLLVDVGGLRKKLHYALLGCLQNVNAHVLLIQEIDLVLCAVLA